MKIMTWNVNSIRQRILQLVQLMKDEEIDVALLQELKCTNDSFPYMELEDIGYNCIVNGQKAYNGVAIISKYKVEDIIFQIPNYNDDPARYIEALIIKDNQVVRVASVYVPNGQSVDSQQFKYKIEFLQALEQHSNNLLQNKEMIVIGGDYNVAPYPMDVYTKQLDGEICHHPKERNLFRTMLQNGYRDAFRIKNSNLQTYSWWDYRGSSFKYNKGMRIDHLLVSSLAVDKLNNCYIYDKIRENKSPSDHAPVVLRLNI